jgi:hypothetical protein
MQLYFHQKSFGINNKANWLMKEQIEIQFALFLINELWEQFALNVFTKLFI